MRGDIRLSGPDSQAIHETWVALCRCGASQNKPFCDNSHRNVEFDDPGGLGEGRIAAAAGSEPAAVDITVARNGPLLMKGRIDIIGGGGEHIEGGRAALCRCGGSQNKPFCDGTHARIGFEADWEGGATEEASLGALIGSVNCLGGPRSSR